MGLSMLTQMEEACHKHLEQVSFLLENFLSCLLILMLLAVEVQKRYWLRLPFISKHDAWTSCVCMATILTIVQNSFKQQA